MSLGSKCEMDSLIGSIVLPETICEGKAFTLRNFSNPNLTDATYTWSFGSTEIIIAQSNEIEYTFNSEGDQTIGLIVKTNKDQTIELRETVSVTNCDPFTLIDMGVSYQSPFQFNIQNPISNTISGEIESINSSDGVIELVNIQGTVVYSEKLSLNQGANSIKLNAASLNQGIYFLRFTSDFDSGFTKLMKYN